MERHQEIIKELYSENKERIYEMKEHEKLIKRMTKQHDKMMEIITELHAENKNRKKEIKDLKKEIKELDKQLSHLFRKTGHFPL